MAATPKASDRLRFVTKYLVQPYTQGSRDFERRFRRRRVFFLFDGYDRLAGNADLLSQLLLSHFVALKSKRTNVVLDIRFAHRASSR